MRSANLFGPLKGLCPHKALIGLTQASGLAGGFDCGSARNPELPCYSPACGRRLCRCSPGWITTTTTAASGIWRSYPLTNITTTSPQVSTPPVCCRYGSNENVLDLGSTLIAERSIPYGIGYCPLFLLLHAWPRSWRGCKSRCISVRWTAHNEVWDNRRQHLF
jgi:hypothetical protein